MIRTVHNHSGPYLLQLDKDLARLSTEFGLGATDAMRQEFQEAIREKYIKDPSKKLSIPLEVHAV